MSSKKQPQLSQRFLQVVAAELTSSSLDTVAILSVNVGSPQNIFARTHARLMRETVALLPCVTPAFKTMEIRPERIFALISGTIPELMDLVEDTHQSLIVLEARHREIAKFCMSLTVAKAGESASDLLERAHAMLDDAVLEFS